MFTAVTPTGLTGEFVASIWLYEGDRPAHRAELRLPTGAVELMINLREDRFWLADQGRHGIAQLAERVGLTQRRVQQVFRTDVGFSPKAYQRLRRFRSALAGIDDAARLGWPTFALRHGYYDQAHLIREFRAHCGLSPTAYLQRRGGQLNHVPLST